MTNERTLEDANAEPFSVERSRGEWKDQVRDVWGPVLENVKHGDTIAALDLLGEPSAFWTRIGDGPMGMWQSGLNVVSTITLLRMYENFDLDPVGF